MKRLTLAWYLLRWGYVPETAFLFVPASIMVALVSKQWPLGWGFLYGAFACIVSAILVRQPPMFEAALPVSKEELLWARVLGGVAPLWLATPVSFATLVLLEGASRAVRTTLLSGAALTLCLLLVTAARAHPPQRGQRLLYLAASPFAALTLWALPRQAALLVAALAALPVAFHIGLDRYERHFAATVARFAEPIQPIRPSLWPLLKLVRWRLPIAIILGLLMRHSTIPVFLPFGAIFLTLNGPRWNYFRSLPISPRSFLWMLLASEIMPFLLAAAVRNALDAAAPWPTYDKLRYALLMVGVQASALLGLMFFGALIYWHRLIRFHFWVRLPLQPLGFILFLGTLVFFFPRAEYALTEPVALLRFARSLPSSNWGLGAVLLSALAPVYLALDWAYRSAEFPLRKELP